MFSAFSPHAPRVSLVMSCRCQRLVIPALDAFKPDLILVSSGFDASYVDPLARMMVSSQV